ncbi:efflux RND transporter periplasmic adaptor subunit [Rhodohalobacter mucosus]|uniref:Efflux transporter periplasmic adaptor subunit n=1 Tax=Rhodohalobacter mucosus TaxID=2079485 RepID=A0A316TPJ7_9BACT|nr:efflux RND transporter periplasmic adaptor subunit [Rhodohalobacter mucosus]PWN06527.1 efflux transporter periplasmic adaptor subunit [Rhodohalobacter mucosus]
MNLKKTVLICGTILIAGAALIVLIFNTEPTASQSNNTRETPMLVQTFTAETGTYTPLITAMGTVEARDEVWLRPRVNGEVIYRSENFKPGGFVRAGEVLLRIDPSDYEAALQQSRSLLSQAQADLMIEMGQQEVARREYEQFDDTLSAANKALVLRQPQLTRVRAEVESAEAAVEQAMLDLERTTIRAPFDAHILDRLVNIGSQVSAGEDLGRLVAADAFRISALVKPGDLSRIPFSDSDNPAARLRNRSSWPQGVYRNGTVENMQASLTPQTRLARVLIRVDDPLGYYDDENRSFPLIIGSYIETEIETRPLENVVRINRDHLRQDDTVWVMDDGRLDIRTVEVVFSDATYAYISDGINDGERIVTTSLASVRQGAPLQLSGSADSQPETIMTAE